MSSFSNSGSVSGVALLCLACALTGCGGSSNSSIRAGVNPPPASPGTPQNVQVVFGDGDNSQIQNTISWTLDSTATGYTVYWDDQPGVTENSRELTRTGAGTRSAVHSGAEIVPGDTYYYRVQATASGSASPLSAEVAGTPQLSITGNQLNDVAWNGTDRLVAVGDSGIILTSPNGLTDGWVDLTSANAPQSLRAVTWENVNTQFTIVGAGSTVLTGDGSNWNREDLFNLAGSVNLEDIAWLGDRYIAVGNRGTILTSNADGLTWTAHVPGTSDINFVATTQWDAGLPQTPIPAVVGSAGTLVVNPDDDPGLIVRTGTTEQLGGITWVDNLLDPPYFVVVGNDGTVLTNQFR